MIQRVQTPGCGLQPPTLTAAKTAAPQHKRFSSLVKRILPHKHGGPDPKAPAWAIHARRDEIDGVVRLTDLHSGERKWLSEPVSSGKFANYRVGVDAHNNEFGVKQVYLDGASDSASFSSKMFDRIDFERLAHERDVLQAVDSPLQFKEVWVVDRRAYCFMPRMQSDLFYIMAPAPLPTADAGELATLVLAVVGAQLAQAHANGIIHQDIKLENIMWNMQGELALGDYGCARRIDEPRNGNGTVSYLSPERLQQMQDPKSDEEVSPFIDEKGDVWALGVALLYLLCHVDNPFNLELNGVDPKEHLPKASGIVEEFLAWRQGAANARFDEPFEQIRKDHPRIAHYIEFDMLDPNPLTRACAADVAETFAQSVNLDACKTIFAGMRQRQGDQLQAAERVLSTLHKVPHKMSKRLVWKQNLGLVARSFSRT